MLREKGRVSPLSASCTATFGGEDSASRAGVATGGVADFRVLSATTALGLAALSAVDAMDRQGCTEKGRGRQEKTLDLLCW